MTLAPDLRKSDEQFLNESRFPTWVFASRLLSDIATLARIFTAMAEIG